MKKPRKNKNAVTLFALVAIIGVMIALVAVSEPLYRMFCTATGLNGTTQNATAAPEQTKDRMITVRFDGNVDSALPWEFGPDVKSVRVKLGEVKTITYHARNMSDKALVGSATDNVQPDKAGRYFNKLQCFCFKKHILEPGQAIELPVKFFVDPKLAKNCNADDVTDITLSYTFYLAKDQSKTAALKQAGVDE